MVRTSGRTLVDSARSLDVTNSTLHNWLKADPDACARAEDPDALLESELKELKRLRKENFELRTDRQFLRKRPPSARTIADGERSSRSAASTTVRVAGIWGASGRRPAAPPPGAGWLQARSADASRRARWCRPSPQVRRGRPDVASAPDLPKRNFSAVRPNTRWFADITEFQTGESKLYIAGVRDLCHRSLVGWSMHEHQYAELVVAPWSWPCDAATRTYGLVHHADRGSQ